jgi:hypothetical protein
LASVASASPYASSRTRRQHPSRTPRAVRILGSLNRRAARSRAIFDAFTPRPRRGPDSDTDLGRAPRHHRLAGRAAPARRRRRGARAPRAGRGGVRATGGSSARARARWPGLGTAATGTPFEPPRAVKGPTGARRPREWRNSHKLATTPGLGILCTGDRRTYIDRCASRAREAAGAGVLTCQSGCHHRLATNQRGEEGSR